MAINRLKHFRVMNADTQTQAAKAAGVTQPTYQRWEAGRADIPKSHLAKLAKHFKITELELLGRHPPKNTVFYDNEAPLELQHYGECAMHFVGGGEPLVLSISEKAHAQAYEELQGDKRFIVIKDLGNRTVAIRHKAISEFYFSSEAYDTYGPDHEDYKLATPIHMPDTRDWAIVEAIRGRSPLVQWRGSKLPDFVRSIHAAASPLVQGRGSKLRHSVVLGLSAQSPLVQGRGSKRPVVGEPVARDRRPSCRGADRNLEGGGILPPHLVAPRAGARIETPGPCSTTNTALSPLVQGRGSKLFEIDHDIGDEMSPLVQGRGSKLCFRRFIRSRPRRPSCRGADRNSACSAS